MITACGKMPPGNGAAKLRLKNEVPTQLYEDSAGFSYLAVSSGQMISGRRKTLAVDCICEPVVGVSKVCQVSQLYPPINDPASTVLGSMMASLFTLQAAVALFS